jgi:hypothetical protein
MAFRIWLTTYIVYRHIAHVLDKLFVYRKSPHDQQEKEHKENDKRYDGPDGYVIDALKNIFIHNRIR